MIFVSLVQQLHSLRSLVQQLTDEAYIAPIEHLGEGSIGAHTRHVIELLQCAINGYETGEVDYINRHRNLQLETDRELAVSGILQLCETVDKPDRQLRLTVGDTGKIPPVYTTYFRELVYNTEHVIHHQALIRVALVALKLPLVTDDFGMAASTIQYRQQLAASATNGNSS